MAGLPPLPQMPRGGVWMVGSRQRTAWASAAGSRSGQSGARCSRSCTAVAGPSAIRSMPAFSTASMSSPSSRCRPYVMFWNTSRSSRGWISGRNARKSRLDIRWIVARIIEPRTASRSSISRASSVGSNPFSRVHSPTYGASGDWACMPTRCSIASSAVASWRSISHWRCRVARFRACRLNFDMADPLLVYGSNARRRSGQPWTSIQLSAGAQAGEEAGEELLAMRPQAEVAVGVEVAVAAGGDERHFPAGGEASGGVHGAVRVVVTGNQKRRDGEAESPEGR